jgi:hypothetical protein
MNLSVLRTSRIVRKTFSAVSSPLLGRLRSLEGIHAGEECYIFGDGASVKNYDLRMFSDRPGIAVGVFPKHVDAGKCQIRYWILPEPMFFWPAIRRGPYSSRAARRRFQNFFSPEDMIARPVVPILNVTNFPVGLRRGARYVFEKFPSNRHSIFGRSDIDYFAGSVNASLSLALYLGFRRAYLVGFDYTHLPPVAGHWYEFGRGVEQSFENYNRHFFSWIQNHIEVVSVVPHEQSAIIPSVTYENLVGCLPSYRENNHLLPPLDLETLSLWDDYTIYPPSGN